MGADHFERTVLGAILLNSTHWREAAVLRSDDFLLDSHRKIFSRMLDLAESSRPIDVVTLVEELERHKELEVVGGTDYIGRLPDGVPDRPSIEHYVKIVLSYATRRPAAKIVQSAQRLVEDATVSTDALEEIGNDLTELAAGIEDLPPRFSEEALALRFSRHIRSSYSGRECVLCGPTGRGPGRKNENKSATIRNPRATTRDGDPGRSRATC